MPDQPLRAVLFGAGDFGPILSRYIEQDAELVAICDPCEKARTNCLERIAKPLPQFADPSTAMEKLDFEIALIASPNHTHRDLTVAAAAAGKHVFCEKAMALSVPECWDMVLACENADVKLMVGHKRRLRPPWHRMIQLRQQLGQVRAMTSCAYHDARVYDFGGWWTESQGCGGTFDVIGVHIIDWMRAMAGDVRSVRALAAPQIDDRYDFPDTAHLTMTFDSGAIGTLTVSLSAPPWQFREAGGPMVVCAHGGMRFVPAMDHLDLYWQHQDADTPTHERFDDLGFDHAYTTELGDFVRWIDGDTSPCLTWREGLRCVEVMEAAMRSMQEHGRVVELPLYPELEPH